MEPRDVHPMMEKAYSQLREGYFEDAVEGFSQCLQVEPTEPLAYQGRALGNFQLKNWSLAVADFLKAKELNPDDAENWIGLAMSTAMQNKIYEAVDIFEQLLARQPDCIRAHLQLAQLYYRMGIITKGHQQLDKALASRPSLAERRTIHQMKNEQLVLDKRRYYRPDFEALNKNNSPLFGKFISWIKKRKNLS